MRPCSAYATPPAPPATPATCWRCSAVPSAWAATGHGPALPAALDPDRIRRLLDHPRAWTIGRLWLALGQPAISLRTLRRRVRQVAAWRRPRLVARGDPDRDQTLAALRQAISDLPQGTVVLAEDETHIDVLPWVRRPGSPAAAACRP
jgi:hypothetical protein